MTLRVMFFLFTAFYFLKSWMAGNLKKLTTTLPPLRLSKSSSNFKLLAESFDFRLKKSDYRKQRIAGSRLRYICIARKKIPPPSS